MLPTRRLDRRMRDFDLRHDRFEQIVERPGIGGGFQHHRIAGCQMLPSPVRKGLH